MAFMRGKTSKWGPASGPSGGSMPRAGNPNRRGPERGDGGKGPRGPGGKTDERGGGGGGGGGGAGGGMMPPVRRLPRILLNAATALSLVLCVAIMVMWARSYTYKEYGAGFWGVETFGRES